MKEMAHFLRNKFGALLYFDKEQKGDSERCNKDNPFSASGNHSSEVYARIFFPALEKRVARRARLYRPRPVVDFAFKATSSSMPGSAIITAVIIFERADGSDIIAPKESVEVMRNPFLK